MTRQEEPGNLPLRAVDWLLLGSGGIGLYAALSSIGRGLNGPAYLVVFGLMWASLMVAHAVLLHVWRDSFAVSGVAAIVLVAVAQSRYTWGTQQGMQRWGFLAIMTLMGALSFFLRASHLAGGQPTQPVRQKKLRRRHSSKTNWSRSTSSGGCGSTGGGCGGGGCGGGGCGGCGGCGG
jgi:hypothetical protein